MTDFTGARFRPAIEAARETLHRSTDDITMAPKGGRAKRPDSAGSGPPGGNPRKKGRGGASGGAGGRGRRVLDPILLSRGLSSRSLPARPASSIAPLSKDEVERDLRHMDAYRNARAGYDQQLFAFRNQDAVRSGRYGTYAPGGGGGASGGAVVRAGAMPSRIDPEEEKRLSALRKRIHQSEFEREGLETEYLSLRAHYVHESQLVRKTRAYEMGRWRMLRDFVEMRARGVAAGRLRLAMGRDVEALLRAAVESDGGVAGAADIREAWDEIHGQIEKDDEAAGSVKTPVIFSQLEITGSADDGDVTTTSSGNERVIPWNCLVAPRTPYDLPLLLSCLSQSTDMAAGCVTDRSDYSAITWLETALPDTTASHEHDASDLAQLRSEVRLLTDEIGRERDRNTELQRQIGAVRGRNDSMAALVQLLRCETEAVLDRHNATMEGNEAVIRSARLAKERAAEEAGGTGSIGSGNDNDESSGEEDEDADEGGAGSDESVGVREGLEITVGGGDGTDKYDDGSDGGSDGGVNGAEEESGPAASRKRRASDDGDEGGGTVYPKKRRGQ